MSDEPKYIRGSLDSRHISADDLLSVPSWAIATLPEVKALVDALCKSAEGWDNVINMGLIPEEHFGSAMVLRDEALEALQRVGVKL